MRSQVGFEPERRSSHPYLCIDFRTLHGEYSMNYSRFSLTLECLFDNEALSNCTQFVPLHKIDRYLCACFRTVFHMTIKIKVCLSVNPVRGFLSKL